MPLVARKSSVDTVKSPDGNGDDCDKASTQSTDKGSDTVFAEGIGVVRQGDTMISHNEPGCSPHAPALSTFSLTVFVEGKGLGRKGDDYDLHVISSGAPTVFAGG